MTSAPRLDSSKHEPGLRTGSSLLPQLQWTHRELIYANNSVKIKHCHLSGSSLQNSFCILALGSLSSSWLNEETIPNRQQVSLHCSHTYFLQIYIVGLTINSCFWYRSWNLETRIGWGYSVSPVSFSEAVQPVICFLMNVSNWQRHISSAKSMCFFGHSYCLHLNKRKPAWEKREIRSSWLQKVFHAA